MKIIAHRGASHRAPENTLTAVRLAGKLRAAGVEVDVRLTRDGHLAVLHDQDTRRVSPKAQARAAKTSLLAELQRHDVGSWKHARFARERVPELGEVLRALGRQREILLELKSREYRGILAALDRRLSPPARNGFPAERVIVMSFHDRLARAIKKARPAWRVLRLAHKKPSAAWLTRFLRDVRAGRLDGLGQNGQWTLSANDYKNLLAAGAILSVWTVDDPREAAAWRKRGFHYLTTNVPEQFR